MTSHAQAEVALVRDGQAVARIYVADNIDPPATLTAAELRKLTPEQRAEREATVARLATLEDLQYHLEKMSGATVQIVGNATAATITRPAIVYGDLAVSMGAEPKDDTATDDAFRIIARDNVVLLGGESDHAASHATYHLLRQLGCDWLMPGPDGEIIPQRKTIAVPDMDVAKSPAFVARAPWYSGGPRVVNAEEIAAFDQWKRRHAQTIKRPVDHPEYLSGGHFWASLISANKAKLDADPTMLPLIRQADGTYVRGRAQLEPTHPGVIDMTVEWLDQQFERNGWPNDHAVAFSIGPNDGGGYSESPEALAAGGGRVDPITGDNDQTDVLILYANKVLERVADKYPNLKLGFYIYSVHADYPMKYQPHKNFVAHFADITYSRNHSILDRQSFTRNYYRGILEQWAKLHEVQGNPMWFYGYNWNLAENLMPYTKMRIWGEDLPYYHKMGVLGHNNEQDKAWSILGPHNYLMARMGWDIDLDWKQVLKEYCAKAFGDGGPYMEQYYLLLDQTQTDSGIESGSLPTIHLVLDREFLDKAKALIAKAADAAKTERDKKMVDWFSQPVTALEIYLDYRDAITSYDFVEGQKQFERMLAHWQKYMDQNANLVSRYGRRYIESWQIGPFIAQAVKHSTDPYKIIYKFPDALPTILDPENAGALMGFYEPAKSEEGLLKTQTFGSTWDAQGLGAYRDGGVWYRVRFPVDKAMADQPIGLFVGSVEDTVHVWLNGEYVGMGRGFIRPFLFDLTHHIQPGEDNLLALQIIRRGKLNEAGLGGMLYPSFIFTGPQLEQKAPAVEPLRRVLPGGGFGEIEN
jgi:hypothetical protein